MTDETKTEVKADAEEPKVEDTLDQEDAYQDAVATLKESMVKDEETANEDIKSSEDEPSGEDTPADTDKADDKPEGDEGDDSYKVSDEFNKLFEEFTADDKQPEGEGGAPSKELQVLDKVLAGDPELAAKLSQAMAAETDLKPGETPSSDSAVMKAIGELREQVQTVLSSQEQKDKDTELLKVEDQLLDTYTDVVKDVPEYKRAILDRMVGMVTSHLEYGQISRETLVTAVKGIDAQLTNMFHTWAAEEGRGRPTVPPSSGGDSLPPIIRKSASKNEDGTEMDPEEELLRDLAILHGQ